MLRDDEYAVFSLNCGFYCCIVASDWFVSVGWVAMMIVSWSGRFQVTFHFDFVLLSFHFLFSFILLLAGEVGWTGLLVAGSGACFV